MGKIIMKCAALLLALIMYKPTHALPSCMPCETVCSSDYDDQSPNSTCKQKCGCDNAEGADDSTGNVGDDTEAFVLIDDMKVPPSVRDLMQKNMETDGESGTIETTGGEARESGNEDNASPFVLIDDMKVPTSVRDLLKKNMEIDGENAASETTSGGEARDAGHETHILRWEYPGVGTAKWRIPYVIGNVSAEMTTLIEEAIADYEANICMEFVQRTTEQSYLHFMEDSIGGCWSYVGRRAADVNYINLESPGCLSRGTVIHEIMHAMGFFHEHQRPDRDNHVIVHWDNIDPDATNNFAKLSDELADSDIVAAVPYDFGSVMQYPETAFSTSDAKTLTGLDGNGFTAQRAGFAQSDIQQLKLMYKCEEETTTTEESSGSVKANATYLTAMLHILVMSMFALSMDS